jgi:hypothetical protein
MAGTADSVQWSVIVGIVMPLFLAVVQQPQWSGTVRRVVTVVSAAVVGFGTAFFNGEVGHGGTVLASIAAVLVASQATYATLWATAAPAVEAATSPKRRRAAGGGGHAGGA